MQQLDADFTDLLLRFLVMDRTMLQAIGGLVDPKDFENRSERIIASLAIYHWNETQEPIGSFLRIEVKDYLDRRTKPMKEDAKAELMKLVTSILKRERPLVAATKVLKMLQRFKTDQFMRRSMDEVLELQMMGELTVEQFGKIAQKCAEFSNTSEFQSRDYTEDVEGRIQRREVMAKQRHQLFMIDALDERNVRPAAPKELELWLAPYKSGKSQGLAFRAVGCARQRSKVIHISGEDSDFILENRLDASLCDLPINSLLELSTELRDRFDSAVRRFRGRIHLVDAVGKDLTVEAIDAIWERERSKGFVADTIVVDYDDKIKPSVSKKERRFEISDVYNGLLGVAGRRGCRIITAAQTGRKGDNRKIIDGTLVAEDIGKIQKATVAIGIGQGEDGPKNKHLYVAAHKDGDSRFGVDIMTNYAYGQFYDREETMRRYGNSKEKAQVELN